MSDSRFARHLFIGGIADGERYEVPVTMEQFVISKAGEETDDLSREVIRNIYRRMPVSGGKERRDVFVYEKLSNDEAMFMFIERYTPRENLPGRVTVILDLSDIQSALLNDAVNEHQDQGPTFAGWASPEMMTLRTIVDKAVNDAIHNRRNQRT